MGAPEIHNYGIIGNGRSCALVSNQGSIDWLCWPRFDSPSLFGAILDAEIGGSWIIRPIQVVETTRKYIPNSNVLETTFRCQGGLMRLTDFMAAFSEEDKVRQLTPEHELIRIVECLEGEIEVDICFKPAPNYAQTKVSIKDGGLLGWRLEIGNQLIALHSNMPLTLTQPEQVSGRFKLQAGERRSCSLTFTYEGPGVVPPVTDEAILAKRDLTVNWWQAWAGQAKYEGPYKAEVIRSALTLKLLGYAPSGAFVAAATTALPEYVGGNINWDYRYCWLRDASFTARALLGLGYFDEVEAFISWLLHSTRLTLPRLRAAYDVYGRKIISERPLPHLKGYQNSRPVQIGNAITNQIQLDVYGEVIDGVDNYVEKGGKLDHESKKMLGKIGEYICKNWKRQDSGIWEERSDLRDYTYSKFMCWAALDKLLKMKDKIGLSEKKVKKFQEDTEQIKAAIQNEAWNDSLKAYVSYFGGQMMDACVLLMPAFGFEPPQSKRMQQTYQKVKTILEADPGLIYRYEKSFHNEGAFLICSFWKIDFIARGGGTLSEAHQEFKAVLKYANDLGLFSEEVDVKTGKLIGNFPQAFTHIGLINAALLIKETEEKQHELG